VEAHSVRALVLNGLGRREQALEEADLVNALSDPKQAAATAIAVAAEKSTSLEDAKASLRQAEQALYLNPTLHEALIAKSSALIKLQEPGRIREAALCYSCAFLENLSAVENRSIHPKVVRKSFPFKPLIAEVEEAVREGQRVLPEEAWALVFQRWLEIDSASKGELREGLAWAERAVVSYPMRAAPRIVRGSFRLLLGDEDGAHADLEAGRRRHGRAVCVLGPLAVLASRGKRPTEAIELLLKVKATVSVGPWLTKLAKRNQLERDPRWTWLTRGRRTSESGR